jgi:hypothetical protein
VFDCATWDDAVANTRQWLTDNNVSEGDFISASVYDDAATHVMGKITFDGQVHYTVKPKRYKPIK